MTIQDKNQGSGPNPILTRRNELSLRASLQSINTAIQLNDGADYSPKVRKPYTITKQREKWTDEEHKKFIEALKLYGRAWRKIEEHVGTKTTVQIRSHAQKFFSKVVRESSGGSMELIEIPPPRPKRKPAHPYPRKHADPIVTTELSKEEQQRRSVSPNSSVSDQEQQSPKSVLSAVGSASGTPSLTEDIGSPSLSQVPDPMTVASILNMKVELFPDHSKISKGEAKEPFSRSGSFKLFGATLPVSDIEQSASTVDGMSESEPLEMSPWLTLGSKDSSPRASLHYENSEFSCLIEDGVLNNRQSADMKTQVGHEEVVTSLGWNPKETVTCVLGSRFVGGLHKESWKSFVPYKRFIAEKSSECEMPGSEDKPEKQRIRLCL